MLNRASFEVVFSILFILIINYSQKTFDVSNQSLRNQHQQKIGYDTGNLRLPLPLPKDDLSIDEVEVTTRPRLLTYKQFSRINYDLSVNSLQLLQRF